MNVILKLALSGGSFYVVWVRDGFGLHISK